MASPHQPETRRIIDFQISLQWLISGAISIAGFMLWMGWSAAEQKNISLQTQAAVVKMEKRFDDKDSKVDDLREKMSDHKSTVNSLQLRVEILERARK